MKLPEGWRAQDERASTEVQTKDFLAALDLFREIGAAAEELEHHPDLHLEAWNRVRIVTYSHDVGRLTARDERLAARIEEILRRRGLR